MGDASGKGFLAVRFPSHLPARWRVSSFQSCLCSLTKCRALRHPVYVFLISGSAEPHAPVRRELHDGKMTIGRCVSLRNQPPKKVGITEHLFFSSKALLAHILHR
jgi:hypothetical protein